MQRSDLRFARAAVRKKRLFLALSFAGIGVALALLAYTGVRFAADAGYPVGSKVVIAVLVLLNARQNLRQYRYAVILERTRLQPPEAEHR